MPYCYECGSPCEVGVKFCDRECEQIFLIRCKNNDKRMPIECSRIARLRRKVEAKHYEPIFITA